MKSHLLGWTIAPALFVGALAAHGCEAGTWPGPGGWLDVFVTVGRIGLFFACAGVALLALAILVLRLEKGRFDWAEVRQLAAAMVVKVAMLVFVLGALLVGFTLAAVVLGGWRGGWLAALGGAGVGATVGLNLGLLIAWLKIPQRLGLDRARPPSP